MTRYSARKIKDDTRGCIDEFFGYWWFPCEIDAVTDHIEKQYESLGFDTWRDINEQLDSEYENR